MKQLDPKYKKKLFLSGSVFIVFCAISLGAIPLIGVMSGHSGLSFPQIGIALGAVALILALLWLFALGSYHCWKYELREEGFRQESGIIWKTCSTIPYSRIQNVDIKRGLFDRVLGLSCLLIKTAASGYPHPGLAGGSLPGVSKETAEQLRDDIIARINSSKNAPQGL